MSSRAIERRASDRFDDMGPRDWNDAGARIPREHVLPLQR